MDSGKLQRLAEAKAKTAAALKAVKPPRFLMCGECFRSDLKAGAEAGCTSCQQIYQPEVYEE